MVRLAESGISHGGISILTPQMKRLFAMRQYEGQQPQFIYRFLLKKSLSEGVNIERGRKVVRLDDGSAAGGPVKVVFEDQGCKMADLVIGNSRSLFRR